MTTAAGEEPPLDEGSGAGWKLVHHGGDAALAMLGSLADLYDEVYAEPPYNSGPMHERARFLDRASSQATAPGFRLVAARCVASGELAGYTYGFPVTTWWLGTLAPEPAELRGAAKFGVIELIAGSSWRGQGMGRAMLGALLSGRGERHATLLAHPDAPARRIYDHWGWRKVGEVRPDGDAPVMDALVLPLRGPAPQ